MIRAEAETLAVMIAVAAACAVPGVLLVLRRLVLVGDAISHVLLFGIVIAFFLVEDLSSHWLMLGAAASGVLTVWLVELLQRTKRLKEDAAIGLVFPALFSLGTLLASMFLRNTHLDIDRVLLGSAESAWLSRTQVLGVTLPDSLVALAIVGTLNAILVVVLFKELKLAVFDAGLAATLGFLPGLLHYGLMASVSLTTVAAFDAVGPVLVVAFFAVPAAVARLLTDRLVPLFFLSVLIAVTTAAAGTLIAFRFDTTIAGTVATLLGIVFAGVFLFAPENGLIAQSRRHGRQRRNLHETMLLIHLLTHENTPSEVDESSAESLPNHLAWTATNVTALAERARDAGLVTSENAIWKLTSSGRERARQAVKTPQL